MHVILCAILLKCCLKYTASPTVLRFGLFVHPFSHTCSIGHINYILQFVYYIIEKWLRMPSVCFRAPWSLYPAVFFCSTCLLWWRILFPIVWHVFSGIL